MADPQKKQSKVPSPSMVLDAVKAEMPDPPEHWREISIQRQSDLVYIVRIYDAHTKDYEGTVITL